MRLRLDLLTSKFPSNRPMRHYTFTVFLKRYDLKSCILIPELPRKLSLDLKHDRIVPSKHSSYLNVSKFLTSAKKVKLVSFI
jgi:hypothetical protein